MRLPLTRLENIALTTIITPLTLSPLCLLWSVRLGGYIVNLCVFYFYKLIEQTVPLSLSGFPCFDRLRSLCPPLENRPIHRHKGMVRTVTSRSNDRREERWMFLSQPLSFQRWRYGVGQETSHDRIIVHSCVPSGKNKKGLWETPWPVPLPSHGVLLTTQTQDWEHFR
jgi:hypothetical protein